MAATEVKTLDDVVDLIQRLTRDEVGPNWDGVSLSEDLTTITIEITGERYHGTVSGDLARGLWDMQQEVYRALAFTLTGVDDKRRLGKLPEDWRFQFEVTEGSTILRASIKWIIDALKDGYRTMDDNHKTIVILGVTFALVGGAGLTYVANNYISAQEHVQVEQERTRQFEVVAQAGRRVPEVRRWTEAAESGAKSVVKAVPDATSVTMGQETINAHQIQEINARAARESPTLEPVTEFFYVRGFKRQDDGVSRFTITKAGEELIVVLDAASFTDEQLDRLWYAAQHDTQIALEIQVKRVGDAIKGAWVTDIPITDKPN